MEINGVCVCVYSVEVDLCCLKQLESGLALQYILPSLTVIGPPHHPTPHFDPLCLLRSGGQFGGSASQ